MRSNSELARIAEGVKMLSKSDDKDGSRECMGPRDMQKVGRDPNERFDFNNWNAKDPLKHEQSFGSHRFFHRGKILGFQRDTKPLMNAG